MEKKIINVIGLGYIGLPTALMLAKGGNVVVGTDINSKLVELLKNGVVPFEEIGLANLYENAKERGIQFTTEFKITNTYIITVPTPYIKASKKIDMSYVVSAVNSVLDVCNDNADIIIESTVSPGSIDLYVRPLIEKKGKKVNLAHAPERIIPGNMIYELEYNSRTIGVDFKDVGLRIFKMYSTFCKGEIVITDIRSAEMSKVIENTYRDVNIAFANELAKICRADNLDVYEIIRIANKHPRVNILQPGPGVGGHCISVDPWFLVGDYPYLTDLIHTARKINDSMPLHVIKRIREIMHENKISDVSRVGLYGLTYKENVDDTRESPGLQLLEILESNLSHGLKSYDPHVKEVIVKGQILNYYDFINDIDFIVILTGHKHILENMKTLNGKIILDTKNIFNNRDKCYKI